MIFDGKSSRLLPDLTRAVLSANSPVPISDARGLSLLNIKVRVICMSVYNVFFVIKYKLNLSVKDLDFNLVSILTQF